MKRIISILLAVMLVASCTVATSALYSWFEEQAITVDQAIQNYIDAGNEAPETYRYYFLMPNGTNGEMGDDETSPYYGKFADTWYKPYADGTPSTTTAGIYWWDSKVADPEAWIGYLPSGKEECDADIYYADVPVAVTGFIWNNGIDGGMDPENPIFYCAAQTINIPSEYYDIGESPNYPDGTENFDNMIFVIDPDVTSIAELSGMATCGGEWYYYYGNGCYGFTADGDETNCLRNDHFDENGNHVGKQTPSEPDTKPTEPSAPHPTYVVGDADGDGEVSIMDATQIQLIVAGLVELTDDVKLAADADGDGEVSIMDATQIQLMVAGLI